MVGECINEVHMVEKNNDEIVVGEGINEGPVERSNGLLRNEIGLNGLLRNEIGQDPSCLISRCARDSPPLGEHLGPNRQKANAHLQ